VPRFDPFVGLRYGPDASDLSGVICPPYDVIDDAQRRALEAEHEANCVRLELPQPRAERDRYRAAELLLAEWRAPGGPLAVEEGEAFYVYRMGFHDDAGRPRQTTGVLGALRLEPPGGGILPHERTTPKDKQDRLDLLRATRTNLSPIWGLSLASGLSAVCDPSGPPDARATDMGGVHHRLWRVTSPGVVDAVRDTVASGPVVIADGHHRYEVGLAYQAEQGAGGPQDAILALVVELAEDQLSVAPIHRLLSGLPAGWSPEALSAWFDISPTSAPDGGIVDRLVASGGMALVTREGTWLLRPRQSLVGKAQMGPDSSLLEVVLAEMPSVTVRYQHGWAAAVGAVANEDADAAILVRPATVEQIAEVARRRERMPPKTTFFTPKPATGMVFRALDDQPS
jgi:uncharacterized protein (DUF1015 family)